MKRLTKKEVEAMKTIWQARKGFVKELIHLHPEPKPHYNTFSSVIRILEEKGFVSHKAYGKDHEYYPLISKEVYGKEFMKEVVREYFGSSYKNVVKYFVSESYLSVTDLKGIIKLLETGELKSKTH
jgi:BlaI family transcriptional regulator, penicillinase repressor